MLVALLSDVHDHTAHLLEALQQAEALGCTHLLFMGDLVQLSTLRTMREEWQHPIQLVFGNNEWSLRDHEELARLLPNIHHHGQEADIHLEGRRIFFCHAPQTAHRAAATGKYDAVFYGHTHIPSSQHIGNTLLANPGELQGRTRSCSFAIYDTSTNTLHHVPLTSTSRP